MKTLPHTDRSPTDILRKYMSPDAGPLPGDRLQAMAMAREWQSRLSKGKNANQPNPLPGGRPGGGLRSHQGTLSSSGASHAAPMPTDTSVKPTSRFVDTGDNSATFWPSSGDQMVSRLQAVRLLESGGRVIAHGGDDAAHLQATGMVREAMPGEVPDEALKAIKAALRRPIAGDAGLIGFLNRRSANGTR